MKYKVDVPVYSKTGTFMIIITHMVPNASILFIKKFKKAGSMWDVLDYNTTTPKKLELFLENN